MSSTLTHGDFLISTAAIASVAAMPPAFAQLPASITDMTAVELARFMHQSLPKLAGVTQGIDLL